MGSLDRQSSNPVIKGKIVRWDLLKPFESTREAATILKENNGAFEPVVQTDVSTKKDYSEPLSPVWGPWIDKVRTQFRDLQVINPIPGY